MHSWAAQEYWGDVLVIAKGAAFFFVLKYLLVDRLSVALSTEGTAAYYNRNFFCLLTFDTGGFFYIFHTSLICPSFM